MTDRESINDTIVDRLIEQFSQAGIKKAQNDSVSESEKQQLLDYLKKQHGGDAAPTKMTLQRKTVSTLSVAGNGGQSKDVKVEVRKKRTFVKRDDSELALKAEEDAKAAEAQAKAEAEGSVVLAKNSLEEAKNQLAQAPTGKGTQADLQALRGDLQAAEATLGEIDAIMAKEDFLGVKAKAESVQTLATRVNEQVAQAILKTGKHKKA